MMGMAAMLTETAVIHILTSGLKTRAGIKIPPAGARTPAEGRASD